MALVLRFVLMATLLVKASGSEDANYWKALGASQLEETLQRQSRNQHAKNVIVFIGDGMGMSTITSARIYKGQKNGVASTSLSFEKFPVTGLSKTYSVNKQVTDSAQSATAMFTGAKTNNYMLGLDATARYNSCDRSSDDKSKVESIATWAQRAGKDTGLVTKTRVTHATPAALYAHVNNRDWECDGAIPAEQRGCLKDIASQLVGDAPGNNMKVIMGGGADQLGLKGLNGSKFDGCQRTDGSNLAEVWRAGKRNSKVVTTRKQLMEETDPGNTDYLLGLFSPDHMHYAGEKQDQPSLSNMTTQAINILKKSANGFVLMVEGGLIDIAHHQNYARLALEDTLEFEEAIAVARSMTSPDDTLIVVTADHSHSFTINGYPDRGNDILGIAENEHTIYETLTYANGPGYNYHRLNDSDSGKLWRDLNNISSAERNGTYYRHFAPIFLHSETHAGEDVPVYASGPLSFVFSGVFESNYIAHAISYVACIGPQASRCGANYTEMVSDDVEVVTCAGSAERKCKESNSAVRPSSGGWLSFFLISLYLCKL
ncbi:Alkaline phosphatase 4 [Blattella germanica]|nr:Alkaline phosphatase 4 [Blattella germanica]